MIFCWSQDLSAIWNIDPVEYLYVWIIRPQFALLVIEVASQVSILYRKL